VTMGHRIDCNSHFPDGAMRPYALGQ